jgi:hypothetical protein
MQASPDSNVTCNAFGTLAHEHQTLNRTDLIFQLIDVSILNTKKMCSSSHLAANEHKCLFDSKSLSNNDFWSIVDSKFILHSEGEHTTKQKGLVNRNNLVYFDNHISLIGPIKLVELISHVGHTNDFVGPSQLIVESKYSKITLHFCKDCRIFCEGEYMKQIIKKDGKAIINTINRNKLPPLAFGRNLAFGLSTVFDRNLVFSLNLAFGLAMAFSITMVFDLNDFVECILVGQISLVSLSNISGIIGCISHNGLVGHTGLVGLIQLVELISFVGNDGIFGLIGLIIFIGLAG